jgi:hypothetical protein
MTTKPTTAEISTYIKSNYKYDPNTGIITSNYTKKQIQYTCHEYITINPVINGVNVKVYGHRLAWFMHYGYWAKNVQHINKNRVDNRIENLRVPTNSQIKAGNRKTTSDTSSKFKGVAWDKSSQSWRVRVHKDNKMVHVGRYDSEVEAAYAYNEKAIELFGEFANINKIP